MVDLHGLSSFTIRIKTPLGYIYKFNATNIDTYRDFQGVLHLDITALNEPTPEPKEEDL